MNADNVLIKTEGLEKAFGKVQVLKGITTEIHKGEVVVIIGPSGSGKSTFLRTLNLLEEPTGGKIYFEGVDITDPKININKHRQKMRMVFQQFNLFPHMTVLKNMTLAPMKLLKLSKADAEKRATELLDRVGLADRANAYPNQLSGGQKQRVAIVRALCMQPDVMLFDEPTRGFGRYEKACGGRHDNGGSNPRNGLCPRGCRPRTVYRRRYYYGGGHARGGFRESQKPAP